MTQGQVKLCISTPCPIIPSAGGTRLAPITMEWHRARMRLTSPFGYNTAEIGMDGYEVGEARSKVVSHAREIGAEFLFFLDYDVLPPSNAIKQLVYRLTATHTHCDVAAGVYCVKEDPAVPIIFKGWNCGPFWDWKVGDVLDEGITGVPMGCTLLRLSLFDRLPQTEEKPWFKTVCLDDEIGPHGTMTEDVWFCKRATEETGAKIVVDTSVLCGHIDNKTGAIYQLPEDSPPIVRSGLKLVAE